MIILYQSITDPGSSRHRGLMRTYGERVLAVQLAPDTTGSWRQADALLDAAADGRTGLFSLALPGLLPLGRFYPISRVNRWWALRRLVRRLRAVTERKIVVVLQLPHLIVTARGLGADLLVYEVRDEYIGQQRTREMTAQVAKAQARLLNRADVVFALSEPLAVRLRQTRPETLRIHQGVDTEVFDRPRSAASSPTGKPPRLGVVGNLDARLDWQLLVDIARRRPDWEIAVGGPLSGADPRTRTEADRFLHLDNTLLLPPVPEGQLVGYIHSFDVGMVPYRLNPTTDCVNPLKAYQYLACGKPVVATPLGGLVDLAGSVRVAPDAGSFVECVEQALTESAQRGDSAAEERRKVALPFDWERIVDGQLQVFAERLGQPLSPAEPRPARPFAVVYQGVVTSGADRNLALLEGYARHVLTVHVRPDTTARGSIEATGLEPLEQWLSRGTEGLVRLVMPSRFRFGRFRFIAQRNRWAVLATVARRLRQAGYRTVVVTQHPHLLPGLRGMPADLTVYEVQDDHVALRPGNRMVARGHRTLVEEADLLLATSDRIADDLRAFGRDIERISNGVDFDRFVSADRSRAGFDLADVPFPRIGLLGNLNERVDWELCRSICQRRPDFQLVVVGPLYLADASSQRGLEALTDLPNAHYLGPVDPEVVAAQMKTFDVGLIPYVESRATRSINPLKAYEYLACGLPVVATALPSLESLNDVVIVVRSGRDLEDRTSAFVEGIEAALLELGDEARQTRIDRVAEFDWHEVAKRQLEIFERRLGGGG